MPARETDTEYSGGEVPAWIADLQTGPVEVSQELVETCRDYLLLVANRNLDDDLRQKVGASDLVQETFLHAHQKFAQFRGTSAEELLAWLRKILLNHLVDENRKYRKSGKRKISRERSLTREEKSDRLSIEPPAHDKSPSAAAMANEESVALAEAMDRLPEDYRQVILLRTWQRLPFEEVGTRMNRSTDAARKLWTRAIERLERELDWPDD